MNGGGKQDLDELIELARGGVLLTDQGETDAQTEALLRIAESTGAAQRDAVAAARSLIAPMSPTGPVGAAVPGRVY